MSAAWCPRPHRSAASPRLRRPLDRAGRAEGGRQGGKGPERKIRLSVRCVGQVPLTRRHGALRILDACQARDKVAMTSAFFQLLLTAVGARRFGEAVEGDAGKELVEPRGEAVHLRRSVVAAQKARSDARRAVDDSARRVRPGIGRVRKSSTGAAGSYCFAQPARPLTL